MSTMVVRKVVPKKELSVGQVEHLLSRVSELSVETKLPTREILKVIEGVFDVEFEQLKMKPRIYHYTFRVAPFNGITMVAKGFSWSTGRQRLDEILPKLWHEPAPATRTFQFLREERIYGVSICDHQDNFSRQYGRVTAKARLLLYLKGVEK